MRVSGPNGETFTDADLAIAEKRDVMRSMVLRNELGEIVVVVNHPSKKHFRVLGSAFGEKRVGEEKDGTHDKCIEYIEGHLRKHSESFRIMSWVFSCHTVIYGKTGRPGPIAGEKLAVEKQAIAQPTDQVSYQWYRGAPARARFPDQFYIESDLCGRPQEFFQPTGKNLGIVIEVIRTHPPDKDTFERLFRLSKTAHLIVFYIIPEGSEESQYNRVWIANGVMELTVSFYLMNGKFYESGVLIPQTGRTSGLRYAQYVQGVLTDAMSKVKG